MDTPQPNPGAPPKIVQRLLVRTAGFLFTLAVIFGVFRWVQDQKGDFDRGGNSAGLVAAVRIERDGQQVVLIRPDGKIVGTESWKPGVTDREPVWSPDGRFLFFASDRKGNTFNVFRWNPESKDAQTRTEPGGSRSNPTFTPGGTEGRPLIVAGGFVRELDPQTGKTPQILPPINAEIAQSSEDGGGSESSLGVYGDLGKSFRIAQYLPGRRSIAAILRRDEGEVLIVQNLDPVNGKVPRPRPVVAGERVDFDLDPTSQTVAFSVRNFRWVSKEVVPSQYRKGNRIEVPFRNMVGLYDAAKDQQVIVAASPSDAIAFGAPQVSPDGTRMLLVGGKVEEGSLRPKALLTLPMRQGGIQAASPLVDGEVYEPSWSADSTRIAYAKRTDGKRDLFTSKADGTEETNLTKGQGEFATPLFSPQKGG